MLFNSYVFIFLFLPLVVAAFFAIGRASQHLAATWLALASLFFYAWWSPKYVLLLIGSIVFNFVAATLISRAPPSNGWQRRKLLLTIAVFTNLAFLGYYKYANFFLESISHLNGGDHSYLQILLPLGISFFTFTQIAFLVDTYQGKSTEPSFIHYCLFVTYFPHLIAGPVLHHKEMMPQFRQAKTYLPSAENFSIGITIFVIGLFKKVVIADSLAPYSNVVFDASAGGYSPTFFEAWGGALAYTLQLYFDFSGYSDMAIGLSRLFNVVLPLNFHSPYRATNIIEFWRCWHMTLSRFLRDYLYIPLGGNRHGYFRRHLNLMITMLLGGLWHGAGWTFVIWGGLHGFFLVVNHFWLSLRTSFGQDVTQTNIYGRVAGRALTFIAVVVGWVIFRSESLASAISILKGMAGYNGAILHHAWQSKLAGFGGLLNSVGIGFGDLVAVDSVRALGLLLLLVMSCYFVPNTQEIMKNFRPVLDAYRSSSSGRLEWRPSFVWAIVVGAMAALSVSLITRESEFLYFQF